MLKKKNKKNKKDLKKKLSKINIKIIKLLIKSNKQIKVYKNLEFLYLIKRK
jgi:hypothetical protein